MSKPTLRCTLNQPHQVARRGRLIRALYQSAVERRETDGGFAWRFPGDAITERLAFDFVAMERDCCPFLSFEVHLAAERGPIWVVLKGPDGVRDLASAELEKFGLDAQGPGR